MKSGHSQATDTPSIIHAFEEQVNKTPGHIALSFEEQHLTYEALNQQANQLAAYLLAQGVYPEQLIGICMDRSVSLVVGILGILKAGAAYVPIDPGYPASRIRYMLEDTQATLVITDNDVQIAGALSAINAAVQVIRLPLDPAGEPVTSFRVIPEGHHLAYVIYTSGTTGTPKGVMIEHRNVVSLVKDVNYVSFHENNCLLSTGSPAFDATTFEYWGMLLNGGRLVLCREEKLLDFREMKRMIQEQNVNMMWLTSSWLNQLVDTDITMFAGLTTLIAGGEKLSSRHIQQLKNTFPALEIVNGYGPTENTTFSLTYPVITAIIPDNIPIGKPLSQRQVYILNEELQHCNNGETGEIYVAGAGVGRGYLHQPDLTEARFLPDPFNKTTGNRMYKTGDLGKWLPDGNVEFKGRTDNQIKIRGYRIEPAEVEVVLLQTGTIFQAVVLRQLINEQPYLTAYIVPGPGYLQEQAIDFLAARLPEYMMPMLWVPLTFMPLTTNGKIDKLALPVPALPALPEDYVAPRNELENQVVAIWEKLLNIHPIGIRNTFFQLGGHSLLLIQLYNDVCEVFKTTIPFDVLFNDVTVEKMAGCIYEQQQSEIDSSPDDMAGFNANMVTFTQRNFFIRNRLNPTEAFPNSGIVYEIKGLLHLPALEKAFREVIALNESLHTSYYIHGRDVFKRIHHGENIAFHIGEINTPDTNIDAQIHQLTQPFDFSKPPLIRCFHIRLGNGRIFLCLDMPHINSDGVSLSVILREVVMVYNGGLLNMDKLQFADFQQSRYRYFKSPQFDLDIAFWKEQFSSEVPPMNFPGTMGVQQGKFRQGVSVVTILPASLREKIDWYLNGRNMTPFQLLISTYYLLLHKLTGNNDITVMIPVYNRSLKGFENIVGLLANKLVVRIPIAENLTANEFITNCKEVLLQTLHHQHYPYELLYDQYKKDGYNVKAFPLSQTFFNYQHFTNSYQPGEATLKLHIQEKVKEVLPLSMEIIDDEQDMHLTVLSAAGVYNKFSLEQIGKHYLLLLERIIDNGDVRIGNIASEIELNKSVIDFN